MKIAILGSAPSSLKLAPFGDESWQIWGCSPGVFPFATRVNAWFELHRWEPGIVGKPATQKPWFSPEYVQWMKQLPCPVYMQMAVPDLPNSQTLPVEYLEGMFGTYFFTSTIAWMMACAIDMILTVRADQSSKNKIAIGNGEKNITAEPDIIGLWGVDMAANEEYGYQRAGCQYFTQIAKVLGIEVVVPPESDVLRPMPRYGIDEGEWWMIKTTARRAELEERMRAAEHTMKQAEFQMWFLKGALDDLNYHAQTWGDGRQGSTISPAVLALSPEIRSEFAKMQPGAPVKTDIKKAEPPVKPPEDGVVLT